MSLVDIYNRLLSLYEMYPPYKWKWVVSYSGGKDSSVLLHILFDFSEKMGFDFEVLHHDTGVEYPILKEHIGRVLSYLEDNGIKVHITSPEKSFFEYMIERGYSFPRWNFRWCCYYLKWKPAEDFFANAGKCLNLIAIRGDETHRPNMFIRPRFRRERKLDVVVASPLVDVTIDDIFFILRSINGKSPLGFDKLNKIYFDKDVRFGCWVCTVSLSKTLVYFHPKLARIKYELVCARCKGIKDFILKLKEYNLLSDEKVNWALDIVKSSDYIEFRCGRRCSICSINHWKKRFAELLSKN